MSSSGKGQSTIKSSDDIEKAWEYAQKGKRGDQTEIIVESFVDFYAEITLLTVTQRNGETLFCAPIGHRQERGDYMESWQPALVKPEDVEEAKRMAAAVTNALTGAGIWGVEFFLTNKGVYFSELSPRPHDTGMVTLAGTQNFSEFELHARTILGLPIPEITLERAGVSAVILAENEGSNVDYIGLEEALSFPRSDVRIFRKPIARVNRRMAVALAYDKVGTDIEEIKKRAIEIAGKIKVVVGSEI